MQFEHRFRAMDTDIDVVVVSEAEPRPALDAVERLFRLQEQRFSRFLPPSLLSRFNAGERIADAAFLGLLRYACDAYRETGGLFNPMILPSLQRTGYTGTFDTVAGGVLEPASVPDPLLAIDFADDGATLRSGAFDGGGIVKGLTVDVAVELLERLGFDTVLVNAGGDMRCHGPGDFPGGWQAAVAMPATERELAWQGILHGAIATSTTLRRRWQTGDGQSAHHLIDPRTGLPADSPYVQVSCIGDTARTAEVWSKAVLIGGVDGFRAAVAAGMQVLAIASDGSTTRAGFA